ncbi:MAG: site-specific DNA-methyltransferase, partial [Magnetococcales bacterium]|nr:site-specific DNA-methyltransferase [Magnetococcales bacterium]
ACLTKSIAAHEVEPLALGMVAWRNELAPIVSSNFYFRDNAFADDVAKSNMVAILTQNLPPQALAKNGIRSL